MRCIKTLLALILLPSLVWAEGVLTPAANPKIDTLYAYKTEIALQEEFIFSSTTSHSIGTHGWAGVNGTTTFVTATDVQHLGIVRRDTSAVINTIATLQPTSIAFNTFVWSGAVNFDELWVAKLGQTDANTHVVFGFGESTSGSIPPSNGAYLEKAAADTNWFCVNNNAGGITRTDTGVATTTNWVTLRIVANASGTTCYVDAVATTNTSNIYTTSYAIPLMIISNTAASSKTVDIDYWQLRVTGLSR